MKDESLLSRIPLYFEKTGPTGWTLKRLLRRAASLFTTQEIETALPVFEDGGKLAQIRRAK